MKNKMILTTILLLSCVITGLYAAAPGGTGDAEAGSPSEETMRSLEDVWFLQSQPQLQDQIVQQLTRDWIRAGRNPRPSHEEVAQHFGGEGSLFTPAILEKVRRNLILSGPAKYIELPLSKAYQGDYESFRDDLIAHLNGELTRIGANHTVDLNLSYKNLGELVRNNPDQCVDLMHAVCDTIDHSQCIVTQLYLDGNDLTTLPPGIFAGLTNLQELWLGSNQLANLPPGIFAGLTNLQILSLNGNKLAMLPPDIFAGLTNLQELWLDENQLTTLPHGIFADLTNLKILSLFDNQLPPEVQLAIRQELPATTKITFLRATMLQGPLETAPAA